MTVHSHRDRPHLTVHTSLGEETRLPPHNLEAERGVLGAILLDNSMLDEVIGLLRADDFYRDSHQILFRAIFDLHDCGMPIDLIVLAEELRRRGEYDRIGGDDGLADLMNSVPHSANAIYHAGIVAEKAKARSAIELAQQVIRDCYSGLHTADSVLERARDRLEAIPSASSRSLGAILVRLSDVEPQPVEYLWPGRIAIGKINLGVGDPSMGKGMVSLAMASAVSTGSSWPDLRGSCSPKGSVLILSAEDTLADTIRPRLDAAGADVSRVHALTMVRVGRKRQRSFSLAQDLSHLEGALHSIGDVRLLVIDPISAYLGGVDEHKNGDIRGLITPLAEMADRRRVAVFLVTHLNKGTGIKALYRATGSLAFVAAARMAWLFTRDRDDPLRRFMLPIKSNIVAEPSGMAFRIVDGAVQWEPDPVHIRADQALAEEGRSDGRPTKTESAKEWLETIFKPGVGLPSSAILTIGSAMGIKRNAIFDAKRLLGVAARKAPEFNGAWLWYPPNGENDSTLQRFDDDTEVFDDSNTWEP